MSMLHNPSLLFRSQYFELIFIFVPTGFTEHVYRF